MDAKENVGVDAWECGGTVTCIGVGAWECESTVKHVGLGASKGLSSLLLLPVAEDGASASACSLSPVAADFFP